MTDEQEQTREITLAFNDIERKQQAVLRAEEAYQAAVVRHAELVAVSPYCSVTYTPLDTEYTVGIDMASEKDKDFTTIWIWKGYGQ